MGIIDWIILGFLLLFIYFGWRKGFTAAVVQFCGHVLTFFLIAHYFPLVQLRLISKFHLGRNWSLLFAILLIVVLVAVIIKLVVYVMHKVLKAFKLSTMNKAAGAGLGFVNGLVIVIIFMVILDFIPPVSKPLKDSSRHRVYAGVNLLKEEAFTKLNLNARMKLLKLPKISGTKEQDN